MSKKLSSGLLPKWDKYNWDDFTNDDRAKELIKSYMHKTEDALIDGVGFFVFGRYGVGKSLLVNLLFRDLFDAGYKVRIISLTGLTELYTAAWSDKDKARIFKNLVQNIDFLCIEDFGKEYVKKDEDRKSFLTNVMEEVINKRSMFNKATFFASSIGADKISARYSEHLSSIIQECTVPLKIDGKDYRPKIQKEISKKYKNQN